jgi:1-deoxy-D-xylulose-5-phosphate reductoisomerase
MKKLLVLGSTGSIGTSTLDIVRGMKDSFSVVGLSANRNAEKLSALSREFTCQSTLTEKDGIAGIERLIEETTPDIVINGIAGSAGLQPSILVLNHGIDLALANKETIVMAAPLVQSLAEKNGCRILPVDSEHSAIFNLTERFGSENIEQIILTASGGPFRQLSKDKLPAVTPADALKHPTWNMGSKITIDSASLANKGLEVIEACCLFHMPPEKIQVVVHPQSLVHSLVRTRDGVLYGQISNPDMKHPILSALCWPDVIPNFIDKFDLFEHTMTFYRPRFEDFPMLQLAYAAAGKKGAYTIAYNAADEIAAEAFLMQKIKFTEIPHITETVLQQDWQREPANLEEILFMHEKAKIAAERLL